MSYFNQRLVSQVQFVLGREVVVDVGQTIIGSREFDASLLPQEGLSFRWETTIASSDGAVLAQIELFNVTAGSVIASSAVQTSLQLPQRFSPTIVLPGSLQEYEVRFNIDNQPAAEFATCWEATIQPIWV